MTAEFKKQSRRTSKYASVFITQSLLYSGELQTNPIPSRKCKANTWRRLSHCLKITQNVAFEFLHFGIFHQFFLNSNIGTLIPPKSFENYSKCRIWIFEFWHFPPIFVLLKLTCLVTLFDRKLQVFKNSPKWTIFGIFNELLSTQNVNVARFARNVEWDFFCDFQTPWVCIYIFMVKFGKKSFLLSFIWL